MSYDSDRPTGRPSRRSIFGQLGSHVGTLSTVGGFIAAVATGGYALYDRMATDQELLDHNMSATAHPGILRDLEERVSVLETALKKSEEHNAALREDLIYVAERYVSLTAAENTTDRRIKMQAATEAVQAFRVLMHDGAGVQTAAYEALHQR